MIMIPSHLLSVALGDRDGTATATAHSGAAIDYEVGAGEEQFVVTGRW